MSANKTVTQTLKFNSSNKARREQRPDNFSCPYSTSVKFAFITVRVTFYVYLLKALLLGAQLVNT